MDPPGPVTAGLISREEELGRIRQFLHGSSAGLVLSGAAGFGKTTLWEAGLEAPSAEGYLAHRSSALASIS